MSVVPADEGGRPDDAFLFFARHAELSVARHADREHDRVVHLSQLAKADVAAQLDISEITDCLVRGRALIGARDSFGALVIGGDAAANQPVGRRQPVDDVDRDIGLGFDQGLRDVKPARPGSDDDNAYRHRCVSPSPTFARANTSEKSRLRQANGLISPVTVLLPIEGPVLSAGRNYFRRSAKTGDR